MYLAQLSVVPYGARAALAQLVEQLSCKQQVKGSSPLSGSQKNSGARDVAVLACDCLFAGFLAFL